ncbi:hypothetical protein PMAYCL1PPCAC_09118 [Pristionchus mayeri]|uniref:Uncharacterized protein n=1 Tax=Pristionchus mayeri TaxID=1317129 RepID=A0AAN5CBZ8_9BILA|nr:hypothetical protein PMAYCL1PPCAC_09095 [Pristionchus mayeri]GMR38923.1 hypothetical protein PMAYCL1PPCAC_09118 [Pristionchus mayeri]
MFHPRGNGTRQYRAHHLPTYSYYASAVMTHAGKNRHARSPLKMCFPLCPAWLRRFNLKRNHLSENWMRKHQHHHLRRHPDVSTTR